VDDKLLVSIDRRLALLTASHENELRKRLADELWRTDARAAMWAAIDGVRGSVEIGKAGGVGERTAQLFVKELLELGLVREVSGGAGKSTIVEKEPMGDVEWFLRQAD
jgi:hypothetical protein